MKVNAGTSNDLSLVPVFRDGIAFSVGLSYLFFGAGRPLKSRKCANGAKVKKGTPMYIAIYSCTTSLLRLRKTIYTFTTIRIMVRDL